MKTVHLKLTSAIAFGGNIHRAGTIVEVSDPEARDLLNRGKAVLATEADLPPCEADDNNDADDAEGDDAPAARKPRAKK